jgi:predicted short-subunit dehydrogenase-like oxidoreductase (DUF2520 family)
MIKPQLGIIGAGKVGSTLARLLAQQGYTVTRVYSRKPENAARLAEALQTPAAISPAEVVQHADLILLTVSDDAITPVVAELAALDFTGKAVIHCAGALGSEVLSPLAAQGARVGSLHPVFPFSDIESAMAGLAGASFALESDSALLRDWLVAIIGALRGQVVEIPLGSKSLYHAALALSSNYTVTLYALAHSLISGLGADPAAVRQMLDSLLSATVHNLQQAPSPADALTGPLVRGDVQTLAAHLQQLQMADPQIASAYRLLAQLSFPLLEARGTPLSAITSLLEQAVEKCD